MVKMKTLYDARKAMVLAIPPRQHDPPANLAGFQIPARAALPVLRVFRASFELVEIDGFQGDEQRRFHFEKQCQSSPAASVAAQVTMTSAYCRAAR